MQADGKKIVRRQIFVSLALVLNEKNEILLGKRHDPKNRGMHGKWEFPGGKVEFGEHPSKTAVREVQEEVRLDVRVERLLDVYSWFHPDRPHIQVVLLAYITRARPGQIASPGCREVSEVQWMPLQTAMNSNIIASNKTIFQDLIKAVM